MSRSSFDPGKTTTAISGRGRSVTPPAPLRARVASPPERDRLARGRAPVGSRGLPQLDLIALDQRVREKLLAHPLDLRARLGGVVGLELEVDHAPHAHSVDGEAEMTQRALDC